MVENNFFSEWKDERSSMHIPDKLKKNSSQDVKSQENVDDSGGKKFCPIYSTDGLPDKALRRSEEKECPIYSTDGYSDRIFRRSEEKECPIYSLDGYSDERFRRGASETLPSDKEEKKPPMEVVQPGSIVRESPVSATPIVSAVTKEEAKNRGPICNFRLVPRKVIQVYNYKGEIVEKQCYIQTDVYINTKNGVIREYYEVRYNELCGLAMVIKKKFIRAIIYDKNRSETVENEFREQLSDVEVVNCYIDFGWHFIKGVHYYLHKKAIGIPGEVRTQMYLPVDPSITPRDCYNVWCNSMKLYKEPGIMATLSAFSVLGVSYRVFQEAKYPPSFLLFMTGKTNSFKTSIAKELFACIDREGMRDNLRRLDSDTRVSMERGLVLSGRDNITVFDDFSPAQNPQKKAKIEGDLEALVRTVGDGSSKSRSNSQLEDVRGEGVEGVVVVTGELKGKGLSSNLRCLYCNIEAKKVNTQVLTWLQKNRTQYGSLIQHFIYYLSNNWDKIVMEIRDRFEMYRDIAGNSLSTGRMTDALITLWIMLDLLEDFFQVYCGVQQDGQIFDDLKMEVFSVVCESERIAYEEDPTITFMRSLATMMENQKLHIKKGRLTENELTVYDGFEEKGYLFLQLDAAYPKIVSWIASGGGKFLQDKKEIASALCREGYAVGSSNGQGKRTLYARIDIGNSGNKINFLKIKLSSLDEFSINEPDFF